MQHMAGVGDQGDQRRHVLGRPVARHQRLARGALIGRRADEADHLVDVGDRDGEADLDVGGVARLVEQIFRAPGDDGLAELQERGEHVAQRHHLRLAAVERDHVAAKAGLQRGEAPELVEHDIGDRVALDLDDDADAVAVALVAHVGDALDALLAHEFGDALDQSRLVHLIRHLGDDDRLALLAQRLHVGLGADDDGASAGGVGGADAGAADDEAAGREVGAGDDLHQLLGRHVGLDHQSQRRVDRLAEVVRRNVGRHADRDAAGAIDQQVGEAGRKDARLGLLLVVVGTEIDGVLVEILQHRHGELLQPRLRVAHRRRRIVVDRAEIALPVDQRGAHRKVLRHAHQRFVDRDIAVRMILADHVADGAGRLVVGPVRREVQLRHAVEDAPMHGLQAVAHVRQRAADDHAHRVIEIAALHLVEDRDGLDVRRVVRLFGGLVDQGIFRGDSICRVLADIGRAAPPRRNC